MELIKVDNSGRITARELYEFLELNPAHFARWTSQNIVSNQFAEENVDYFPFTVNGETPTGGKVERADYHLTIEFAKKLCMVSKSSRGEQARNYFIEVEKRFNQKRFMIPQTLPEALRLAATAIEEREAALKQLAVAKPKVEFYDDVAGSKDAIEIGAVAKMLNIPGIGRNKLFSFLRGRKVLMKGNQPYQEFVDRGYFRVIEQKYTKPNGDTCINIKTLVYQKGLDYIRKLLTKQNVVEFPDRVG